ncbi:hypothetical protein [Vreelandella aquamarina]|uniref:hypothetical protein n=1 Tax=Vreelandella aquamarina TaxID=77097 RepID=UPI000E8630D6|nr:hypothetical protein [Halomonas meridiana]MCC4289088.1 hypothetical protein [Halomonas meridiana]HBK37479.1 hypothetical protein [Halomonas sp.]|tara:strand:- start:499 stop:714 length:216 start_codon:yes stop_codon:yes gene_type:complete
MTYEHYRNKIALECASTLSMAMITGAAIAMLVGGKLSIPAGLLVIAYNAGNLIYTVLKRAELAAKENEANG